MNRNMNRIMIRSMILRVPLANFLWFAASFPEWCRYRIGNRTLKATQVKVIKKIITENSRTSYGLAHAFSDMLSDGPLSMLETYKELPLSDYEDYTGYILDIRRGERKILTEDEVLLLEPTGGSSGGSKLIPYTRSLQKQFRKAIDVWIANMFLFNYQVLFGKHYWSISPNTQFSDCTDERIGEGTDDACVKDATDGGIGDSIDRGIRNGNGPDSGIPKAADSCIRIGFAEDAEYLDPVKRLFAQILFAVPSEVSRIHDMQGFEYVTVLFLVAERNLRLISVWNPTFLMILMDKLGRYYSRIVCDIKAGTIDETIKIDRELRSKLERKLKPDPKRAQELSQINISDRKAPVKIWPKLKVISCWTDGNSSAAAKKLDDYFPGVKREGKGLLATEGIVSIPFGKAGKKALAYRSHFFEFIDQQSKGLIRNAWELEKNHVYNVVITTGGGLFRYKLCDLVKVTGFTGKIPCFDFLSKGDIISDTVGEKINESHVARAFALLEETLHVGFGFRLLAPVRHGPYFHYSLFIEPLPGRLYEYERIIEMFERELAKNFHYQHARNLSQLKPLRLFLIKKGTADRTYRDYFVKRGKKAGDIKTSYLRTELDWDTVFVGQYYQEGSRPCG
ncbi:MAG: GH3 auxin-responsive promoter family protein [bacterium]